MIYWRAAEAALGALASDGFSVERVDSRWRARGYQGINATIRDPHGFDLEVQLHTALNLAAAELTHSVYWEQRGRRRGSGSWRELETQQRDVWKSVPVPL